MADAPRQNQNGGERRLTLLQITNAAFPTGAFVHSYGFETWIASRVVNDPVEAEKRSRHWLRYGIATADAVAVVHAFRSTLYEEMRGIEALNRDVGAIKLSREIREGSLKSGWALLAACRDIFELAEAKRLDDLSAEHGTRFHHAIVYGALCAGLGITEDEAVETFLWTSYSSLASVLGRLVPIGQVQVQRMLAAAGPLIAECSEIARTREPEAMSSSFASLDAAAMRHERLPSRLCMT